MKKYFFLIAPAFIAVTSVVAGCATTGQIDRADVYQQGQLNAPQKTEVVTLLVVSPAKIAVDNTQGKQAAQVGGAIVGALLGGAIGHNTGGYSGTNTLVGGALGGVAGGAAGGLAPDKVLVDGVTLTYKLGGQILSSTQVGKPCEFLVNTQAVMISTNANDTRIQPNGGVCPEPKK